MGKADGMNYAPESHPDPVVKAGEFPIASVGLDHGHIFGMTQAMIDAGAEPRWVYDPDPAKMDEFRRRFPSVKPARSEQEVLQDPDIRMVVCAAVPSTRGDVGLRVLDHGKHFLSDKAPFTTLEQVERARTKVKETGRIWAVCYSERLHNEAGVYAGRLIEEGTIGRVVQVMGMGPHRLNAASRPDWFFRKSEYGGILIDIGSHQVEQFLAYAGATDAVIGSARVGNYNHPQYPELEDFGDATLTADNGATNYFRVDWFTPDGLGVWGDGRTFIVGTEGYIELRKYIDVATSPDGDQVYFVDGAGEHHVSVKGRVGYPYFGELVLDCLNGTENAMTQEHTFKAAEICIRVQLAAERIGTGGAS
ncbi:Gfo/Idh/MocA family protein [Salinispira pacifica]